MLLRSSSGCDFLVVGLGNPGSKYWNTRHNVGYAALDALAKDLGVTVDRVKFQGLTAQANLDGHKLILLKPTTYMNLSGQSVQAAAKFYKVPPEHILVLSDDISLDPGRLRVRKSRFRRRTQRSQKHHRLHRLSGFSPDQNRRGRKAPSRL